MGRIRYLSDGALKYIKSRLDSIEKKIISGGNNIVEAKSCEILSIKTNKFVTYYNADIDENQIIYMTTSCDTINGNINILVDDKVYNISVFYKDGFIFTNDGSIGEINYMERHGIPPYIHVIIDCIINNKKITTDINYEISKVDDITRVRAEYLSNSGRGNSIIDNNTLFEDLCNAMIISIDNFDYYINRIDVTNKIITCKCINAPLNEYNFELQIEFPINKGIKIISINSNYINIKM